MSILLAWCHPRHRRSRLTQNGETSPVVFWRISSRLCHVLVDAVCTHVSAAPRQKVFWLKTWRWCRCFKSNWTNASSGHLGDATWAGRRRVVFFLLLLLFFLRYSPWPQEAPTGWKFLGIPPKFQRLENVTWASSNGKWVKYRFWMNYPFNYENAWWNIQYSTQSTQFCFSFLSCSVSRLPPVSLCSQSLIIISDFLTLCWSKQKSSTWIIH